MTTPPQPEADELAKLQDELAEAAAVGCSGGDDWELDRDKIKSVYTPIFTELLAARRCVEAAEVFWKRLQYIRTDQLYMAVWQCAENHGVSYKHGPTYEYELKLLEESLTAYNATRKEK